MHHGIGHTVGAPPWDTLSPPGYSTPSLLFPDTLDTRLHFALENRISMQIDPSPINPEILFS